MVVAGADVAAGSPAACGGGGAGGEGWWGPAPPGQARSTGELSRILIEFWIICFPSDISLISI